MPIDLEIIRASEFLRLKGKGEFDLVTSCALLGELARACKKRGIQRALLDIRQARAELTPAELGALINAFRELGFTPHQRLAILHAADRFQRARMFAFISKMRGWKVEAFADFEEALCWLSAGERPEIGRNPATEVPIAHLSRAPAVTHSPVRRHALRVNRQH